MAKAIRKILECRLERPAGRLCYRLVWRRRTRRLRLTVGNGGAISISVPARLAQATAIGLAERFLRERAEWLDQAIARASASPIKRLFALGREDYLGRREEARRFTLERLTTLNRHYGFTYRRVSIRNQRTRWGSANHRGDLSFNYRLIYLPPALADYIVVHELCHLKEPNHSSRFWALVGRAVPDHLARRSALRTGEI